MDFVKDIKIRAAVLVTEALMMGLEVETLTYDYKLAENGEDILFAMENTSTGEKIYCGMDARFSLSVLHIVNDMSADQLMTLASNVGLNKLNRKDR